MSTILLISCTQNFINLVSSFPVFSSIICYLCSPYRNFLCFICNLIFLLIHGKCFLCLDVWKEHICRQCTVMYLSFCQLSSTVLSYGLLVKKDVVKYLIPHLYPSYQLYGIDRPFVDCWKQVFCRQYNLASNRFMVRNSRHYLNIFNDIWIS